MNELRTTELIWGVVVTLALVPVASADDGRAEACAPRACELSEGAAERGERIRRMYASVAAAGPSRGARIAEAGRRTERVRDPLARVFAGVYRAAIETVRSRPDLDPHFRDAALARLAQASLRWVDVGEYLDDPALPRNRSLELGCGPILLDDEGWVSRSYEDVVICPGFLLLELERAGGSVELAAEAAAFLIAHELGHVIERSANDLQAERAADEWAYPILASYVRARAADGGDPWLISEHALGSFCDLPGDEVHDDGTLRAQRAARAIASLVCVAPAGG